LPGCETSSLALREEHTLRVFENRALRRIFGPRREVVGGWRRLYNKKLHYLYTSRRMRWAEHVAWIAEIRNIYKIAEENLEERDHIEELHVDGGCRMDSYVSG
jgi:hypothetical protein